MLWETGTDTSPHWVQRECRNVPDGEDILCVHTILQSVEVNRGHVAGQPSMPEQVSPEALRVCVLNCDGWWFHQHR